MKKLVFYLVAALACTSIVITYSVIGVFLGWKNGGGFLSIAILFGVIVATWKGIIGLSKRREPSNKEGNNDE